MNRLISLFLLLLGFTAGLSAQDTQTLIQRNHYPADKFEAAIEAGEALTELYRKNGAVTPMTTWVFDDNTIEFVWEVESSAGIDLIGDEYEAARMRIGKERVEALAVPAMKKEFWMGGEIDELSYLPEGTDLDDMGFIHVIRARIKTEDMDEFRRVAAEEAQLAKAQNRQTPFYLEMYPMGLGTREFEVVEFGKDRADWERREAASKAHYDSPEYKAWEKKRDAVAEVISTRTAVRSQAMSVPKPEEQEETTYLYIDEYRVADGKMKDVLDHFDTYRELSEQYHYAQASHFATSDDNRTLMNFVNLNGLADLALLQGRSNQMRFAPAEALARVRRDDKGFFTAHQRYLLQYTGKYSYRPADHSPRPADQPNAWRMTVYDYELGKGREVYELLGEIKAAYAAAASPIVYNVFTPTLGGPTTQVYVVAFGDDKADLRRLASEGNAALGERGVELQERLEGLTSVVRRVSGTTHFDKRYTPRTAGE